MKMIADVNGLTARAIRL